MKMNNQVEWADFASRHNMKWSKKSISWNSGAFLGNGLLGAVIYSEEDRTKRNVLRFVMGRTDIYAKIPGESGQKSRIPLGEIALETEGLIRDQTTMELDLYQAEFRGTIVTTKGEVTVRSFVHSQEPVIVIEISPSKDEQKTKFQWYAHPEVSSVLKNNDGINVNQYIPDIKLTEVKEHGITVQTQKFSEEEGCIIAYQETIVEDGKRYFYLTIVNGYDDKAKEEGISIICKVSPSSIAEVEDRHRSWWREYYQKSFVSLPDTQLEGFYLIQMYKLASAAHEDSEIIDNQGPWLASTPWPRNWFNMNVQLAYSPVYTSNHLEIGESLIRNMNHHKENLIRNVAEEYREDSAGIGRTSTSDLKSEVEDEIGNLTWLMHNYWRQYRYSMDQEMLREHLYPLLRRSIHYYLHLLVEGEDGKLHLPKTTSPEYRSFEKLMVEDTTYDLSLLRWGCITLLQICNILHLEDPLEHKWRLVLETLTDYHQDETGLMIGKGIPLEFGHRHFSHLFPIFPLHLISGDTKEEKEFIITCLRHWFQYEGDLRGFTFSSAASIAATIGEGNEALQYIKTAIHLFEPNTMYREAGPVIESPLAIAESIQDMLLQSWGNEIRVFPAVPDEWKDIVFHNLRTEGAFLISAVKEAGTLQWIRVCSLAGEPCRIQAKFDGEVHAEGDRDIKMWMEDETIICLDLQKGEEAVLFVGDTIPEIEIKPVEPQRHMRNYFGENKPWRLYGIPLWSK